MCKPEYIYIYIYINSLLRIGLFSLQVIHGSSRYNDYEKGMKVIRGPDGKKITPVNTQVLKVKLQYFGHLMQRADSF